MFTTIFLLEETAIKVNGPVSDSISLTRSCRGKFCISNGLLAENMNITAKLDSLAYQYAGYRSHFFYFLNNT